MRGRRFRLALAVIAFLLIAGLAETLVVAQEAGPTPAAAPPEPVNVSTQHSIQTIDGRINYTATAAEYYLRDENDKPVASFFAISYRRNGVDDPGERPITFVFNGGPGSASIWLHFGLVGPQVIDIPSDAADAGAPPYNLRDNAHTILRATDLVFVDPVGTGFSRALGEKENADYWGIDEDADSVTEFIRLFITRHNRWRSPKYIIGESYGTIRAAAMVPRLARYNIAFNGIILVSAAMNMGTLPFVVTGHDLPFVTHLPAYTVAAIYHQALPEMPENVDAFLEEARAFAGGPYLAALFKGDRLSEAERLEIAQGLHRFTGIDVEYILRSNLRVNVFRFRKELLRERGKIIGLLDSRYLGTDPDDAGEFPSHDPTSAQTAGPYVANFQSYLKDQLGIDLERRYLPISRAANRAWKRTSGNQSVFAGFEDVTPNLERAAATNADMRFFIASGIHDLTTSFFASEYMMDHSGIDAGRITLKNYFGGHMMYHYRPSFEQMSNDLVAFINDR